MKPDVDLSPVYMNARSVRFRVSDCRAAMKITGKTLSALIDEDSGADLVDRMQTYAFFELRRRERAALEGLTATTEDYHDPAELWDLAEDVDVVMGLSPDQATPDPLDEQSS